MLGQATVERLSLGKGSVSGSTDSGSKPGDNGSGGDGKDDDPLG